MGDEFLRDIGVYKKERLLPSVQSTTQRVFVDKDLEKFSPSDAMELVLQYF